jgi:hypothetical protein
MYLGSLFIIHHVTEKLLSMAKKKTNKQTKIKTKNKTKQNKPGLP